MKRKLVVLLIAAMTGVMLFGCGSASGSGESAGAKTASEDADAQYAEAEVEPADSASDETQAETPETKAADSDTADVEEASDAESEESDEDDENYETGDAGLDDPRNQDGIGDKEILVVSFGTSYNDSRRLTIGAIEQAIADAYPDWSVRRAFTSQIIIDHVKERDGEAIDNVKEALDRAVDNGVKELVIQPTHLMDGFEYNDLIDEVASYSDAFEKVSIGDPLLISDDDIDQVAGIVHDSTASYDDGKTAVCFMGHGTEADSNAVYDKVQKAFDKKGYENYYIGTVEATPSLDDVIAAIDGKGYDRVMLRPLMVVAGDHANNDMAGDDDDSWKSILEADGYEVVSVLEGLGQLPEIQQMYVARAGEAIKDI